MKRDMAATSGIFEVGDRTGRQIIENEYLVSLVDEQVDEV
jgi:hypothetical protein